MAELDQVAEAFRACDRTLRAAISGTAADADPEQLNRMVGWLKEVQRLLVEVSSPRHARLTKNLADHSVAAGRASQGRNGPVSINRRAIDFPRFYRDQNDNLVKIGWSKKSGSEYEHKAPRNVLSAVVHSLADAGRNRRRFAMEELMPFRDPVSGTPAPDYQAYIVLAWLRSKGMVTQHGRQGYTLSNGTISTETVDNLWNGTPTR